MESPTAYTLDEIVDGIAADGWAVAPNFLGPGAVRLLRDEAVRLDGAFRQAGIGRAGDHRVRASVRGDQILWLDPLTTEPGQRLYLDQMAEVQLALNRALFLGLFSFEAHFAVYPPGASYKRHLDAFHDRGKGRLLSCVLYLNEDWSDADGGHLRLYLDGDKPEPFVDVAPEAGTLAVFLSERFEHEVLPARRERMSVTGWFSVRT